ncbi:MAG: DUF4912 domain-containing protein [Candidatus Omnitrophota bacterium]|nr:DUF4912 domain-containing protein [Candidatus Omnitrophota bacterium]
MRSVGEKRTSRRVSSKKATARRKASGASKKSSNRVTTGRPRRKRSVVTQAFRKIRRAPLSAKKSAARKSKKAITHAPSPKSEPVQELQAPSYMPIPERELPGGYGDNHIYLMVRDPHWMFSYWEIQRDHEERALAQLDARREQVKSVLRVYDITNPSEDASFCDLPLFGLARQWYIEVEPGRGYVVEIGLLHEDGRFVALARSNEVTVPRDSMSDELDERWMGIDFDKMYALSGGFAVGQSSLDLRRQMEQRLSGAITSGSGASHVSSISSPIKKQERGFWFHLDCELIVYGATEPDAKVTLQGQDIKLRPDGTFSMRFALPDGKIVLDATATSADDKEERTIVPKVERNTDRPAPYLKPEAPK